MIFPAATLRPSLRARRCSRCAVAAIVALAGVAGARELSLLVVPLPEAYFQARLAELRPLLLVEEVVAFERLDDERERLDFLEAAWQARDPTPGTSRNEARLEHEARLRVAHERLGTIAVTDPDDARLRVIGLLGDPDEVLSAHGASSGLGVAVSSPLAAEGGGLAVLEAPPECPTPPVEVLVYHGRASGRSCSRCCCAPTRDGGCTTAARWSRGFPTARCSPGCAVGVALRCWDASPRRWSARWRVRRPGRACSNAPGCRRRPRAGSSRCAPTARAR
jgi:GWxTD domain-containing protein